MADTLFEFLARLQGQEPWGAVLDAGTGDHSLRWICGLPTTRWTAITGDAARATGMRAAFSTQMRDGDRILAGNWTDPMLLAGEVYDVVLADYLLGALDGFAPYFQDRLFGRLRPHVGGHLYAVGLAPYPDVADTPGGRIVLEIARLRDACILLAGHRCYREYPFDWTVRHLEAAGFTIDEAVSFPIVYNARFIRGQLDVCERKLPAFTDRALAATFANTIAELRDRALKLAETERGIRFGEDWVVAARPVAAASSSR